MSKIVCDICGTSYDDATGVCPVCGWEPGSSLDSDPGDVDAILPDDLQLDDIDVEDTPNVPPQRGKAVFDYDAVNTRRRRPSQPAPRKEDEDEDEEDEEEPGSNKFLVFILVLLILALLAVSIYIGYTKILKPNQKGDVDNKPQDSISAVPSTSPVDTTDPEASTDPLAATGASDPTNPGQTDPITSAIPCTGLSLDGSVDELTFAGQYRRISVRVTPENTTDQVTYTSGDPNVVTVDDKGHVTAVGEGQTVIVISCGSKRIDTPIVVKYAQSATEASTNPAEATAAGGTDTAVATPAPGNILALKRNGKTASDVTIGKIGVYITLELDNDIPAENVKWSTSDSSVATVFNGNVTAIGKGNCVIRAEYNGQTAECVVRVK